MPLVRFQVRNEYGLGAQELYRGVSDEDPKGLLEGVTVAGLVGILRQLGDLAEFAAEVFHDLQEQVMTTAARSHKMIARVHHIEASIPAVEKAVLAQKSHIHFAYTNGSVWHPKIQTHRNHFIYSDLPRFIMDVYEECRDHPSLHLLDKFDKGGPGSCLRRYSDPSYFKKALTSSELPTGDKVLRDKKARKNRKKGLQRNREVSHGVSISDSGRSPIQHEDQEHNELTTSWSNGDGSILVDELEKGEYYDLSGFYLEPSVPKSSSVSWDEKAEIVKPMYQQSERISKNQGKASELLPSSADQSMLENRVPTLKNIDMVGIISDSGNTLSSVFYGIQSEDEADSYMDALNTMESEVETDVECQTKRLLGIVCETGLMPEMNAQTSESSDVETCTSSYSSSYKQRPQNFSNSISSEDVIHAQPPQMKSMSSDPHVSVATSFYGSTDPFDVSREIDFESASNCPSSSGSNVPNSQVLLVDKIVSQLDKSEESSAKISDAPSVKFWTNGGLLGLQPSKPPDFSAINVDCQDYKAGSKDEVPLSSETVAPKSHSNGLDMLVNSPEHKNNNPNSGKGNDGSLESLILNDLPSDQLVRRRGNIIQNIDQSPLSKSFSNKQDDDMSKMNSGVIVLPEANIEKSGDSHHTSSINNSQGRRSTETSIMKTGLVKLQDYHIRQEGRNRVVYQTSPEQNPSKQIDQGSPLNSACSSPPLEHMNISVHPINVSETSILKLKFPPEHHFHQCNRNVMFPSFQLLPELSTSLQGMGYESDDTFYRSSPDISEELMSQQSDSNSEQWDFEETPRSAKNPLHKVSSDESISSPFEHEEINDRSYHDSDRNPSIWNGFSSIQDGPRLDFPSFDAVEQLTNKQAMEIDSCPKDHLDMELQYLNIDTLPPPPDEPTPPPPPDKPTPPPPPDESTPPPPPDEPTPPPPPPLPPMEWRVIKPNFSVEENEQTSISNFSGHLKKFQVLGVTPAQQLKTVPSEQPHIKETTTSPQDGKGEEKLSRNTETIQVSNGKDLDESEDFLHRNRNKDQQKLSRSIETIQASNGKDLDEREDLLHQIRNKSFNLRSTTTARPTLSTSPTANTKVAAILEKANAIRQAFVGSDEGEDDENWTDG